MMSWFDNLVGEAKTRWQEAFPDSPRKEEESQEEVTAGIAQKVLSPDKPNPPIVQVIEAKKPIEPNWFERKGMELAMKGVVGFSSGKKEEDEALIKQFVPKFEQLIGFIRTQLPQLLELIEEFFPTVTALFKKDATLLEGIVLHILVNLIRQKYGKETPELSPEQFLEIGLIELSYVISRHLRKNNADELYDALFPESRYCTLLTPFSADIKEKMVKYYGIFHFATVEDPTVAEYKHRLGKILWNVEEIKKGGIAYPSNEPTNEDFKKVGIDSAIEQFYDLCSRTVSWVVEIGFQCLADEEFTFKFLKYIQTDVPETDLKMISKLLSSFANSKADHLVWLREECQKVFTNILFKMLVNSLKKVHPSSRYPVENLFFKSFEGLLSLAVHKLPALVQTINLKNLNKVDVATLVTPFVNECISLFSKKKGEFKDFFPFPKEYQEKMEGKIREKAPQFFAKILIKVNGLIQEQPEMEKQLNALFPEKESCNWIQFFHLIPHLAPLGIPYLLRSNGEKLVDETIMPFLIEGQDPQQDFSFLDRSVRGLIQELGQNESPELMQVFRFVGEFSGALLLKFVTLMSQETKAMEDTKQEISLVEDFALKGVIVAQKHFDGISQTKKLFQTSTPSREQFIQTFDGIHLLHPALRGEEDKKASLNDLTQKTFEIFRITKESKFPVPKFARGMFYQGLEKITPVAIDTVCTHASKIETINQMLITVLNQIAEKKNESPMERLFASDKKEEEFKADYNDSFQQELQKEFGELLVAVVGLQPSWLPKKLIEDPWLKEVASEALGQSLRKFLQDNNSLLTILEEAVGKLCEAIAPGGDTSQLKQFFPKTAEEIKQKQENNAIKAQEAEDNIPRVLRALIEGQTDRVAVDAFIKVWDAFEAQMEEWLLTNFGEKHGGNINSILVPVFRFLVKLPLTVGVLIFNYTIWLIASQILKFIIESDKRIKDLEADIHDNAIYHGVTQMLTHFVDKLPPRFVPRNEKF